MRRYPGEPVTLTLQNVTLQFCIQQAFSAKAYQVTGPGWIKSTRYDLTATLPPGADVNQIWPALQTLLAERLKLSVRHDKREMLLYAMTLAPGGSKIRARTDAGPKALRFQAGAPQDMGDRSGGHASGTMRMNNSSLENFCDRLSRRANHPVVDRTGLQGTFDFEFEFSGTSSSAMSKALEKQLGLKVEPVKDMVEMLIVESAVRKPVGE